MFRRPDGSWKVLKSDRGRYVKILAENVKNPDEIWFDWRRDPKTVKWNLRRRYLSRFDLDGGQESCLTVFKVARTGLAASDEFRAKGRNGQGRPGHLSTETAAGVDDLGEGGRE